MRQTLGRHFLSATTDSILFLFNGYRGSLPEIKRPMSEELDLVPRLRKNGAVPTEQVLLIFERKIFRTIYGPKYEDGEWKIRSNRELEELSNGKNIVKWIKGQRISWLGHLERMEEDRTPKKIFTQELEETETKTKTQERMERRSRRRSSSVGSEKVERVGDRYGQMERYCSTGQSPQRAVASREGEEECIFYMI